MKYIVLALALFLPLSLNAAGPTYTSILELQDPGMVLKVLQLGSESRLHCDIRTLLCAPTDAAFTLATSTLSAPPRNPAYDLLPEGASWLTTSPNGRYVAYYIPATQKRSTRTFGILDTTTEKLYTVVEKNISYWDLLSEGVRIFSFSPDSSKLLYLSDKAGPPTLYQVNLSSLKSKTFTATRLIARNYTVSDFGWLDTSTLYFTANRENPYAWHLYRYQPKKSDLSLIAENVSYASTVRRVGDSLLFISIVGNTAVPKSYSLTTRTVSSFTLPGVATTPAPKAQTVTLGGLTGAYWPASATSTLVVWLHGGPYRQTSTGYHPYFSYAGYDWVLQELTEAGVPVLKLDYPGSFGYGRPFAESLRLKVGTKDVKDTSAAIATFAKARGFKHIYVIGNSYGGYLASKLLVEKLKDFRGAFAIAGVWDWSWLTEQLQTSIFNVHFDGVETEKNKKLYDAAAVYGGFEKLNGHKVFIAHGESDMTIPFAQSQAAYDMLRFLDKPATLLAFPGEDHVFKKKESFTTLCHSVLAFAGAPALGRCTL